MSIHSLNIENYKSIRKSGDILLGKLNIFIGQNGADKSNFISLFKFLNKLFEQKLRIYISEQGGADNLLCFGIKNSDYLAGKNLMYHEGEKEVYEFKMIPDNSGGLIFESDIFRTLKNNVTFKVSGGHESSLNKHPWGYNPSTAKLLLNY